MSEILKFTVRDNPVFFSEIPPDDMESLVKEARLFYAGTHKGKKYAREDLDRIVANFNPEEEIPVQLDHSPSARDTVGLVRGLFRKGSEIWGKLEFLGKEVVEKVRLGLWKKVSVGLSIKQPEMKLQEVSITPFPALENARIYSEIEVNGKDAQDDQSELIESETGKDAGFAVEPHEIARMVDYETMRVEYARLMKEKEDLEERVRLTDDERIIETFVREGRTTPAMREAEMALFHTFNDRQRELFFAYKDTMPAFVNFRIFNRQEARMPGDTTGIEADKEAEEILKYTNACKDGRI